MEVIPEVRAAARELAALSDLTMDLVPRLEQMSAIVVQVLPSCVGLSLTVMVDEAPFTVTATSSALRELDAVQYALDGPCVAASETGDEVSLPDLLDESRWQEFATAAAARGVRSSLSVPLSDPDGVVRGAVNVYASEPAAFDGGHAVLARILGGHISEAVANADLEFASRERARQLPQQLADHARLQQAVGVLVARRGVSAAEARERIEVAAHRADISIRATCEVVIELGTG